jgi:hypothetical protein
MKCAFQNAMGQLKFVILAGALVSKQQETLFSSELDKALVISHKEYVSR